MKLFGLEEAVKLVEHVKNRKLKDFLISVLVLAISASMIGFAFKGGYETALENNKVEGVGECDLETAQIEMLKRNGTKIPKDNIKLVETNITKVFLRYYDNGDYALVRYMADASSPDGYVEQTVWNPSVKIESLVGVASLDLLSSAHASEIYSQTMFSIPFREEVVGWQGNYAIIKRYFEDGRCDLVVKDPYGRIVEYLGETSC
jgi:hypothetical protein